METKRDRRASESSWGKKVGRERKKRIREPWKDFELDNRPELTSRNEIERDKSTVVGFQKQTEDFLPPFVAALILHPFAAMRLCCR